MSEKIIDEKYNYFYDKNLLSSITKYNKTIETINNNLNKKNDLIFCEVELEINKNEYFQLIDDINNSIKEINTKIQQYNQKIQDQNSEQKKLIELNIKEAYRENQGEIERFKSSKKELENLEQDLSEKEKEIEKLNSEIKKIQAEQENFKIPLDEINSNLLKILTNKKLQIEFENNRYYIKSNNKNVEFKKLSEGEKNIISLCYFFTKICEESKYNEIKHKKYLICIDDPITSFDFSNRIGVSSFLKNQIENFGESKFIITTHDFKFAFDISKKFKTKKTYIISGFEIKEKKFDNYNQYNTLLKEIYKFANKEENELSDITISNSIRRVLEAFTTFEYNKGINELEEKLKDKKYIFPKMMKVLLDSESHTEMNIKQLNMDCQSYFSNEEKIKAAKTCFVILYDLNSEHLKSHCKEMTEEKIKEWRDELSGKNNI